MPVPDYSRSADDLLRSSRRLVDPQLTAHSATPYSAITQATMELNALLADPDTALVANLDHFEAKFWSQVDISPNDQACWPWQGLRERSRFVFQFRRLGAKPMGNSANFKSQPKRVQIPSVKMSAKRAAWILTTGLPVNNEALVPWISSDQYDPKIRELPTEQLELAISRKRQLSVWHAASNDPRTPLQRDLDDVRAACVNPAHLVRSNSAATDRVIVLPELLAVLRREQFADPERLRSLAAGH